MRLHLPGSMWQPWHENCLEDLRKGRLDTVITVAGLSIERSVCRETIFRDEFVCVVSVNHPLRVGRVTRRQYLKHRHVMVTVIAGSTDLG